VVELVGGPQGRAEERVEVKRSIAGGNIGFLSEGDGAEARSATGTQFGCCRTGRPWAAFIRSKGWRL